MKQTLEGYDDILHPSLGGFRPSFDSDLLRMGGGKCRQLARRGRAPPAVDGEDAQALGYFYYEEEPGGRSTAKMLTKDEVRRITSNVAELPELLRKPSD
jgi:hypothetical protein